MFLGMNKQPQFVVREVITQNNAPDTEKTGINTSTVEESQTTSSSDIEKLQILIPGSTNISNLADSSTTEQ